MSVNKLTTKNGAFFADSAINEQNRALIRLA